MESLIILIVLIVLAIVAFKFLSGVVKHVVTFALFIIGAALVYHWLTGGDVLGIAGFVTGFLP